MKIERPLGHTEVIEGLWRAAANGRLAHALCFVGPEGSGKFLSACWFAAGLLCREGALRRDGDLSADATASGAPCGSCPACKKLSSGGWRGNHPDLLRIDPLEMGDNEIKVSRIAERTGSSGDDETPSLAEFLSLKASEGGARVVLVRDAERMNESAQNALLKTLEEPAPSTYLVLVTARPNALLATIRSRVLDVGFKRLASEDAASVLTRELPELDAARRTELSRLSDGSPGRAIEFQTRGVLDSLDILEQLFSGRLDPPRAASALWDVVGEFPGERALAQQRARAGTLIELLISTYEDALRALHGTPLEELRLEQRPLLVQGLGAALGSAGLEHRLEGAIHLVRDLGANMDPAATLDRALHAALPNA